MKCSLTRCSLEAAPVRKALKYPQQTDLSYMNARVRGMRGGLLKKTDYGPLMKAQSMDEVVEKLRSTEYAADIEAASARSDKKEEILSIALKNNLSETFARLWKITPEGAGPLLKAVFSNWEVFCIKTVMRGLARGVKRDDIQDVLVPAGDLDSGALNTLVTSKDVPDLVRFLETWASPYARPLKRGLPAYEKDGRLIEMEVALDKRTNEMLLDALSEGGGDAALMREWMSMKIDIANVLTLFKIRGQGYTGEGAAEFFIEGGKALRRQGFIELSAAKDNDALFDLLKARITDMSIGRALASIDPKDPLIIEELFEEALEKRLSRMASVDPLTIALPASFIYMKVRETKNLRLIGRARSFGMPEAEMERLLIYPI